MPTYETIENLYQKLKANAVSVQSELGGSAHELLGLTLSRQSYVTITGVDFTISENPGTLAIVPTGLTYHQISEIVRQHKENVRVWRENQVT